MSEELFKEPTPESIRKPRTRVAGPSAKEPEDTQLRTRLNIATHATHPFTRFVTAVKQRGIRQFDANQIVAEALEQLSPQWCAGKLEEITPLEFKITAALNDPKLREQLSAILAAQSIPPNQTSPDA